MPLKLTPYLGIFALTTCFLSACVADNEKKSNQTPDSTTVEPVNKTTPRNIILFIGDGMGVSTVTAARIFDGQSQGLMGEEHALAFEGFENLALVKTYNTNSQVPDSAGTATAIMSGYKTNIGVVNIPPNVTKAASCDLSAIPETLGKKAKQKGLSIGIISTARITHATPAAMFSHAISRDWEHNSRIDENIKALGCTGIAEQLVSDSSPIDIALGGGRRAFDINDETYGPNLTTAWTALSDNHLYAADAAALRAINPADKQNVLGLFDQSHMDYEADRNNDEQPSLAEMTNFAIDNLAARQTGYILMVEAGRVDHAHHGSNAYRALTDMQALNEAVKAAIEKTGEDTLILVTADHSHVFTMAGYPTRGNPILGLVRGTNPETGKQSSDYTLAKDGKPYTTLGYQNGANVRTADSDALTDNMVQAPDFQQQVAIPTGSETHAGEDVPLYATGPGSENVRGVMEQDEIGTLIQNALELK